MKVFTGLNLTLVSKKHIGEIHSPLSPLTPSTGMPTARCWQAKGHGLIFKTDLSALKTRDSMVERRSKGKGWLKHLFLHLWGLHVASHQWWLSGMMSWALPHAGNQKHVKARREWGVVSLVLPQTPPHTQKIGFIFAAYGYLRPETYHQHQQPFDWQMLAHTWWKKWWPLSEWISEHLTYAKDFLLTSLKHCEIHLCQCLPVVCWVWRLLLGLFFLFPWMPWITAATSVCSTICCHCLLTGTFSWDVEFTSLLW